MIGQYFNKLLVEQEFLETSEQWKKVLALLPKKVADELDKEWNDSPRPVSSLDKWGRIIAEVKVPFKTCIGIILSLILAQAPVNPLHNRL